MYYFTKTKKEIIFIDSAVEDSWILAQGVKPGIEVIFLEPNRDGIRVLSEVLARRRRIDALHIVSHGASGSLQLGNSQFDAGDLETRGGELCDWAAALSEKADILIYGCNVAAGDAGAAFVRKISKLTGASVAAADDLTGSAEKGGNWKLKVRAGTVRASLPFQPETLSAYPSVLAVYTINPGDTTGLISAIDAANATPEDDTIRLAAGSTYTLTEANNPTSKTYSTAFANAYSPGIARFLNQPVNDVYNLIISDWRSENGLPSIENATIGGKLTFEGNGATIERSPSTQDRFRIFHVDVGANLSLDNLTLSNGDPETYFPPNVSLNIGGLPVTSTTSHGGAILNKGDLIITNSIISNNQVEGIGGGIFNEGNLNITNSRIDSNKALLKVVSGITDGDGGGIFNHNGNLTIQNSILANNMVEIHGGALYSNGGTVSIVNNVISGNQSNDRGGAIFNNGGDVTVEGSSIYSNEVKGKDGGGIFNDPSILFGDGNLTVKNSTIANNRAHGDGGGLYNRITSWGNSTMTLINSTIAGNVADSDNNGIGDGGGLFRQGGDVIVQNTIIADNFDSPNNAGSGSIHPDVSGTFAGNSNNLIGDLTGSSGFNTATGTDLSFASLGGIAIADVLEPTPALNAATTGTPLIYALAPSSPAINAGNNNLAATPTDQRGDGFNRISGNRVDIGAYEKQIDLVISEIMYAPASSQPNWEWLEVYNPGSETLDLSNFILDDDDGTALTAPNIAGGAIAPGQTAILYNAALNQADFTSAWGSGINLVPVTDWPELDDSGDSVALWPNLHSYQIGVGAEADRVNYNSSASWPNSNNAASIYLTDLSADNNDGNNWALSAIGQSSPTSQAYESASVGGNSGLDLGSPAASDTVAPTATVTTTNITKEGGANYEFKVTYSDNRAIDASSLSDLDLIIVSPSGSNIATTLGTIAPTGNEQTIEATYKINAPGGSWDLADNGDYKIQLQPARVTDTTGNYVAAGILGNIQVKIDAADSGNNGGSKQENSGSATEPSQSSATNPDNTNNSSSATEPSENFPTNPDNSDNSSATSTSDLPLPATSAENSENASNESAVVPGKTPGDGETNLPASLDTAGENSNRVAEFLADIGVPEATAAEAASQLASPDATFLESLESAQVAEIANRIEQSDFAIQEVSAADIVNFVALNSAYLALPTQAANELVTDLENIEAIAPGRNSLLSAIANEAIGNEAIGNKAISDRSLSAPSAAAREILNRLESGDLNFTEICERLADSSFANSIDRIANFAALGFGENSSYGDDRDNTLIGGDRNNSLYGLGGNDTLLGYAGADTILGGEGTTAEGSLTVGNSQQDLIFGNQDDDLINGNEGADTIYSGQQNDLTFGGKQGDLIWGDRGNDTLFGDLGNDSIFGGPSNPEIDDSNGGDLLLGGSGNDFLNGNQSNDTLAGGEGNDTLHGGQNDDLLCGHSGSDILWGDLGSDTLLGGEGDDILYGGQSDTLIGGSGSDLLGGLSEAPLQNDRENDFMAGGVGADIFIVSAISGLDTVLDFQDGQDLFLISGSLTFEDLAISALGSATQISLKATGQPILLINGVDASSIDFQDFS